MSEEADPSVKWVERSFEAAEAAAGIAADMKKLVSAAEAEQILLRLVVHSAVIVETGHR